VARSASFPDILGPAELVAEGENRTPISFAAEKASRKFSTALTSTLTVLLWRPVEHPPLMPAGVALELQHADVGTLQMACWLATLGAADSFASRDGCRRVLCCHGTTIRPDGPIFTDDLLCLSSA
jgi:hypothetical protein